MSHQYFKELYGSFYLYREGSDQIQLMIDGFDEIAIMFDVESLNVISVGRRDGVEKLYKQKKTCFPEWKVGMIYFTDRKYSVDEVNLVLKTRSVMSLLRAHENS